jgi:hypothetical protein
MYHLNASVALGISDTGYDLACGFHNVLRLTDDNGQLNFSATFSQFKHLKCLSSHSCLCYCFVLHKGSAQNALECGFKKDAFSFRNGSQWLIFPRPPFDLGDLSTLRLHITAIPLVKVLQRLRSRPPFAEVRQLQKSKLRQWVWCRLCVSGSDQHLCALSRTLCTTYS